MGANIFLTLLLCALCFGTDMYNFNDRLQQRHLSEAGRYRKEENKVKTLNFAVRSVMLEKEENKCEDLKHRCEYCCQCVKSCCEIVWEYQFTCCADDKSPDDDKDIPLLSWNCAACTYANNPYRMSCAECQQMNETPPFTGCIQVSGSPPQQNWWDGIYRRTKTVSSEINEHVYENKRGMYLYWSPESGGQWQLGAKDLSPRAYFPWATESLPVSTGIYWIAPVWTSVPASRIESVVCPKKRTWCKNERKCVKKFIKKHPIFIFLTFLVLVLVATFSWRHDNGEYWE